METNFKFQRSFTKSISKFSLLFMLALLMVSCSSDDDSSTSNANVPDGVPSGEIVPESERALVLTGVAEGEAGFKSSAKLWKYDIGEVMSDDCPEENQTISGDYFLSYKPEGVIEYTNPNGNLITTREWEWGASKNSIIVSGTEFFFSELNNNQVVYYSEQNPLGCNVTTYEVMHEPTIE